MANYTNVIGGSLDRKFGEIPSVFDFNCPFDGTSDCSLAINKAIVSVAATGGGKLKLPGGYTYSVSSPILFSAPYVGQVTAIGTNIVTKTSGSSFDISGRFDGSPITINSIVYTIDHVVDATHLQTTTSVPSGTGLTFSIAGTSNVTLEGDGTSSVIFRAADMLDSSGNPTLGVFDIQTSNICLRNFKIDGNVLTAAGVLYSTIATSTPAYDPAQNLLVKNSSVWIHGGVSHTKINSLYVTHTGGYAVFIDARTNDISDTNIIDSTFINNRPHLFGITSGDLSYGSWTGGIHYQCDGTTNAVKGLTIHSCKFSRSVGNQIWGHGYAFTTLNSNIIVTNNTFMDIGRDCIELGNTSTGLVEHNTGRRVGYITTSDTSASTPKYLGNQYAVFLDTTGVSNCIYNANSCISVYGAFCDLDGFAYGVISNNMFRQPVSGDPEYTEDGISAWADNYAYGVQTANNYFQPGGTNVSITGNTIVNCKQGGIRLFSAIGCHVSDNTINHPATSTFCPIFIGNFNPASGGAKTDSYNTDIVNNNIQWNPGSIAAAVQESENWSGSPILWVTGEKNWVADNKLFGNCFEFSKAPSSSSVTGTLLSSQASSITTAQHALISRKQSAGVNYTSFDDPTGATPLKYDDTGNMTLTAPSSSDAFHHLVGSAGRNRGMTMHTGNTLRWAMQANSAAESGSNVGSDFTINRYDDSGNFIDTPFIISRNTGIVQSGYVASVTKFFNSFADVTHGTATASGATLTWASGATFTSDMVSENVTYNNTLFTVLSYIDSHNITLTPSPGTVASALPFYIGNAFQTSTGTMEITAGGWLLFQNAVASGVFNSSATGSNRAFQTASGTMYINGDGTGAFAGLATNLFDIGGTSGTPSAPPSGDARIAYDTVAGQLKYNLGGAGWVNINGGSSGSNTQVIFNSSGSLTGSANFTYSSNVLTVVGTGAGVVSPLFNSSATGSNLAFSSTSGTGAVNLYANGQISGSWFTLTNQGSAPTAATGNAFLYANSSGLFASINTAGTGGYLPVGLVPASSSNEVIFSSGTVLQSNANFTFASNTLTVGSGAGTGVIAPLFNAHAGGANLEFQGTASSIDGNGQIATTGYLHLGTIATTVPTSSTGSAYLYLSSGGLLMAAVNGNAAVNLLSSTPPGSNTQVIYNNSGAYGASSGLTFTSGSSILSTAEFYSTKGTGNNTDSFSTLSQEAHITGNGDIYGQSIHISGIVTASSGAVSPVFNATAPGVNPAFQVAAGYAWNGDGSIGVKSLSFGFQGSALTGGAGTAMLSATTLGVYISLNGGAPTLIGGGASSGSSGYIQFSNGSGGFVSNAGLTFNAGTTTLTATSITTGSGTNCLVAQGSVNLGSTMGGSGSVAVNVGGGTASITGNGIISGQSLAITGNITSSVGTITAPNFVTGSGSNCLIVNGTCNLGLAVAGSTGIVVNIGGGTSSITGDGHIAAQNLSISNAISASSIQATATSGNSIQCAGLANLATSITTGATIALQSGNGSFTVTGHGDCGAQSFKCTNQLQSLATGTNLCFTSPLCTINGNGAVIGTVIQGTNYIESGSPSFTGTYYIYDSSHILQTGYTGSVASAAGRNVVGGIIV